MPALITAISLVAHKQTDLFNLKLKLLNRSGKIRQQYNSYRKGRKLDYSRLHVQNVYFIRVEKVNGRKLSFANLKVYGTQG